MKAERRAQLADDRQVELERAVQVLRATVDLGRELGMQSELPQVLEIVAERGRELVDADACLVLHPSGCERLAVAEAVGELPSGLVGRQLDVLMDLRNDASEVLDIPLHFRGRELGSLIAVRRTGGAESLGEDEKLLLSSFATTAAFGIPAVEGVEHEKLRLALEASEKERCRWARELHDETLQELGALRMMQEGALRFDTVEAMRCALQTASEQMCSTISGLEGMITELRPDALDELGVEAAIEALVIRLGERHPIEISLLVDLASERGDETPRPIPAIETTIYRVAQEALNNVAKHADAVHAWVSVVERGTDVSITVDDDGRGIEDDRLGDGFGLVGMRERIELASGKLEVGPAPTRGTRVQAKLPMIRLDARRVAGKHRVSG